MLLKPGKTWSKKRIGYELLDDLFKFQSRFLQVSNKLHLQHSAGCERPGGMCDEVCAGDISAYRGRVRVGSSLPCAGASTGDAGHLQGPSETPISAVCRAVHVIDHRSSFTCQAPCAGLNTRTRNHSIGPARRPYDLHTCHSQVLALRQRTPGSPALR